MAAEEINPQAQIEWSENQTPYSTQFDDFYYSTDSGLAEADYIFLQHNLIAERLSAMASTAQKSARLGAFCIAETGFGTGLNFLTTLLSWQKMADAQSVQNLHFISFEKYPLSVEDLRQAHAAFPELSELSVQLIGNYPLHLPGWHDVWFFDGQVRLTLWFGDVLKGLSEFNLKVDAWYLDGFTPSRNPDMWQPELYKQMARLSHLETTFATFTAAGHVRRGLEEAGFEVKKDVGYGQKRELCFGKLMHERSYSPKWPWFSRVPPLQKVSNLNVCVVGAGLSGASVAYQLASMGMSVTVLDAQPEPDWGHPSHNAEQASANLAGAVHPLVTADWNLRSEFYLKGFETTLKWLQPWLDSGEIEGRLDGLMQLAVDETQLQRLQDAFRRVGLPEDFAVWSDAEQATEMLGMKTDYAGAFFPKGGWIEPQSVVKKCLSHENITVHWQHSVEQLIQDEASSSFPPTWQILTDKQALKADVVVLCTGALSDDLNDQFGLPIRPVKGQVSHFSVEDQVELPKMAVTHKGYTCPCRLQQDKLTGKWIAGVTGATFEAPDRTFDMSDASHEENITQLTDALQVAPIEHLDLMQGKIGFRPTTPDHLPIVGAIADSVWVKEAYYSQSHTHAVFRYPSQKYQTGLFVSNGHGARGLMSVFLAAEMIAADILGSTQVLPVSLADACHPERFRVRFWRSAKSHSKKQG
jgi:tRNA 5-methylaminomethyl-2-thiouridine biosynthesis bifunctional protein